MTVTTSATKEATRGTVSTATARFVLAALQEVGADSRALAHRAGLPVWALGDNTARVPRVQLASLWRLSLGELGDPRLGSRLGCQWRFGALHLYDHLFSTAETLGEALAIGLRYIGIVSGADGTEIGLAEDDGRVTVVHQPRHGLDPDINAVMAEFGLSVLITRIRHTLGSDITPLHVGLAAAAPASHRELAAALGARRMDFGQDSSTMSFARADLGLPMPGADPRLAPMLQRYAGTRIAAPGAAPQWLDRFRQVAAACLAARELSLGTVAGRLGMSPRSLQRWLELEATSWRAEVDALRREQAARMAAAGMSRTAMASRLGYSDPRSLRRAARRWDTGGPRSGH
jgi:AraC-like DNA-binding protein